MIQLRPYQQGADRGIDEAWAHGAQNVCAVLPTGAGKTVLFANKINQVVQRDGVAFAIAHRQELVSQISLALAAFGVPHCLPIDPKLVRWICGLHTKKYGQHFYDPQARVIVVGVRSLLNKAQSLSNAIGVAELWVVDESHHICRANQWGQAVKLFPSGCKGLGVTATPERADGRGLGRHADGVFDVLVEGPQPRELIDLGYLSDYKIYAPETHINLASVPIGSTGDYSKPKLVAAVKESPIVGDIVSNYLKFGAGKLGVTFVPSVEIGDDVAANFVAAGVPAMCIHAKTKDTVRQRAVDDLSRGDLKNLVNVDIFGEGFDLPAVEIGSMGRPTQSFSLCRQQYGRVLRPLEGKTHARIIDHVGNWTRHGLPDSPRQWSLDSREKRSTGASDLKPIKACRNPECLGVYEGYSPICPYCGFRSKPEANITIDQVDGDLIELDPETLAKIRGEVARIDAPPSAVGDRLGHAGAPRIAVLGAMKNHRIRQEVQQGLRAAIATWGGYQRAAGADDSESYRRFYRRFGVDVLSAQALGKREAEILTDRIVRSI